MDPLTGEFWVRVGASVLCGAIIGFERQLRGKPAGIRTSVLVCLATQVFVNLALSISDPGGGARVVGQIVTGVGFLGAGVIIAREGLVTGVTSAAVVWVLAAVGATIGAGAYQAAIALTLVTVAILIGVEALEGSAKSLRKGDHAPADPNAAPPKDRTGNPLSPP